MTYLHWRGRINQQCTSACTSQSACFQQLYGTSCKFCTYEICMNSMHCTFCGFCENLHSNYWNIFWTCSQIVCSDSAISFVQQASRWLELLQWSLVTATLKCEAQSHSYELFLAKTFDWTFHRHTTEVPRTPSNIFKFNQWISSLILTCTCPTQ